MCPNLAGDLAGGSGGGGSTVACGYYGSSVAAITWTSLTWTGIHNALTIVDVVQEGITRANSDWTFARGGLYKFDFRACGYNTAANDYLCFRARRAGATVLVGLLAYTELTTGSDRVAIAHLAGLLRVTAGDVVSVEYAVTATWNAFGGTAIDGTTGQVAALSISREGD